VSCAVSRCDADHGSLDLALGSLELLCAGIGSRIPKDTMDDAYAAASEADDQDSSSPRASASTTRNQKTSTAGDATAESTSTKTTSTRSRRATSTSTSAPASTPPRPTIEPSLPSLMLLPTSTLAAGSRGTGNSVGGNGSPFDSPGSPSPSMAPGALLVLGALAILYLRI
jgi:cobalamin biosynthesis Mg chelatase CobN